MLVHSIFESISGEAGFFPQGIWCTFIRLQGCNLRCHWCFGIVPGRRIPRIIYSRKANKKLNEVRVGDKLMTFSQSTREIVETEVVGVFNREVDIWLRITIEGKQYFVTEEHPFFTTRGLIPANELRLGDQILHSSSCQKMSFQKKLVNPMKRKEVALKSAQNTDYKETGRAIRNSIKQKKSNGTYHASWEVLSKRRQNEVRKKISQANSGANNGNWRGGKQINCNLLKDKIKNQLITSCSICGEDFKHIKSKKSNGVGLDVHHRDGNRDNDLLNNLQIVCESCHYSLHQAGYNFWKSPRKDGKKLAVQNGYEVQQIKKIDRNKIPPSVRPKPLKVYNLQCSPHNSYIIDYMWVHNCDTPEAQARESDVAKEMSFEKIADQCHTKHILITGGEPLFRNQNELIELIMLLINKKHFIQIETNGSINLPGPYVPPKDKVFWVMDRKTLSSGMTGKMISVDQLKEQCEVNSVIFKYVISHELDLNWAISDMKRFPEQEKFIISPVDADGSKILWMKNKILRVSEELIDKIIFSIQMHKILNLS